VILDVLDGGLLTTVQDAGRPDWTHLGVPVSGPADSWSHAAANLLAGNDPALAALEMTLVGPRLVAREGGVIALAGADVGGRIDGARRLTVGRSHRISTGDVLTFEGMPEGMASRGGSGARCYLALAGGVDVPVILGSRSTCLAGGFGGLDGRALEAGDRVVSSEGEGDAMPDLAWPAGSGLGPAGASAPGEHDVRQEVTVRILPGPSDGFHALVDGPWQVSRAADRVGIRLEGRELPDGVAGETLTHGVPIGAIQVPPDGRPIILGPDHQTTGGYRVPAVVIAADLPLVGQLRPGDAVRLVETDLATAHAARAEAARALREAARSLREAAVALRAAAVWDDLASSAGA
jgi:antagonist of KipI